MNCKTTATHKWCPKCEQNLPHSAFNKARHEGSSLQPYCRQCQKELRHQRIAEGKPERTKRQSLAHNLWKRYKLTIKDYDKMLIRQGGCAICGTNEPGKHGRFHVDHNHKTGEIRALLCHRCNTGLGLFKEDTSILQRAVEYLNSFAKEGEE